MSPQLVATVLSGIARGVNTVAPDETVAPAGPATGQPLPRRSGGHYVVPSYDNRGEPTSVPLAEPAFEILDEVSEYPGIEDIQHSPEMARYFGLRNRHRPKGRRLPAFPPLRSDDVAYLGQLHDQLGRLDELGWTTLERWADSTALPSNWYEAAGHINRFMNSAEFKRAKLDAVVTDRALDAARSRAHPGWDALAVPRLGGREDVYQAIKDYEKTPSGAGSKEFRSELEQRKQAAKDRMRDTLRAAGFDSVEDFDDTVRALRRVVRDRAVVVALTTMKESERVLRKELYRYREPEVLNKLATAVANLLATSPDENAIARLATEYPILLDEKALQAALNVRNPDILREVLLQNAQAQLDNITKCRLDLAKDPEHVFHLNRVIDDTLDQMGLPPKSVQAVLIREGRAKPRNAVREVIDTLLLVLGFAWGPLAFAGYLARATTLVLRVYDANRKSREKDRRQRAEHVGRPLADPLPDNQLLEILGLFLAANGVVPRVPTTLLGGGARLPVASAPVGGTVVGFRHGTQFARVEPGKIAIWHRDYPGEMGILTPDRWVTRYRLVGGAPRPVGRWRLAEKEAADVNALAGTAPKALPAPATPTAPSAPTTPTGPSVPPAPSAPAAPPVFGSLGAMSRLSRETQAAEARLESSINDLIGRTKFTARAFRGFAIGPRRTVLLQRAEALERRLNQHLKELLPERFRFHFPMNAEKSAIIARLDKRLYAAADQVRRLERLTTPVPFPTPAEQALIDRYVRQLAELRQHQLTGAVAQRDAVRAELIGIEQRAARHNPGEEALLPHIETLARARRRLLSGGVHATEAGQRSAETAATIALGGLANRTYPQIVAVLGQPRDIAHSGAARTYTWVFGDHSKIRLDVPGPGDRPFLSGSKAHLARIGRDGTHYDDQGIAVPPDSTPAHIRVIPNDRDPR